jgi:hypothetical protein
MGNELRITDYELRNYELRNYELRELRITELREFRITFYYRWNIVIRNF